MKKLGFILMLSCISFFAACSDDDKWEDPKDYAKEIASKYVGNLSVALPGIEAATSKSAISVAQAGENKINITLKDFSFAGTVVGTIELKDIEVAGNNNEVTIKETVFKEYKLELLPKPLTISVKGKQVGNTLDLQIDIADALPPNIIKVTFKGDKNTQSGEAKITEVAATHASIQGEVVLDEAQATITLYLKEDAKLEDLKEVVFTFKTSDKAIATPVSGSKIDLTTGRGTITVTAEDGVAKTVYNISASVFKSVYDMEEWVLESSDFAEDIFAPVGDWATSNIGAAFLSGITEIFANVTQSIEAHGGKFAARLMTLDTESEEGMMGIEIPRVTPASLFTGKFNIMGALSGDMLKATEFGVSFNKKPLTLKGYYKYEAGKEYHKPVDVSHPQTTTIIDKKDECSINGVLYEIASDDDTYLTGVDVNDSPRVVARANFTSGDQATYKEFSVDFEIQKDKTYDPKKKYRLAIIASSSKGGDKFSGAPGSTLFLDDLEIISE